MPHRRTKTARRDCTNFAAGGIGHERPAAQRNAPGWLQPCAHTGRAVAQFTQDPIGARKLRRLRMFTAVLARDKPAEIRFRQTEAVQEATEGAGAGEDQQWRGMLRRLCQRIDAAATYDSMYSISGFRSFSRALRSRELTSSRGMCK